MAIKRKAPFDPKSFLAKMGEGRSIGKYNKDQVVFSQGGSCRCCFLYSERQGEGHRRFGARQGSRRLSYLSCFVNG